MILTPNFKLLTEFCVSTLDKEETLYSSKVFDISCDNL